MHLGSVAMRALALLFATIAVPVSLTAAEYRAETPCPGLDDAACHAMTALYFEGVSEEIAQHAIDLAGEPWILRALVDGRFRRPDNLAAFLYQRGSTAATRFIVEYVETYDRTAVTPERFRALYMAPMALGKLAARGDSEALKALLGMTAHGGTDSYFSAAVATSKHPLSLRADLLESALRGLAISGLPAALHRLHDVENGVVVPTKEATRVGDEIARGMREEERGGGILSGAAIETRSAETDALFTPNLAIDPNASVHAHTITWANHAEVFNPMLKWQLDVAFASSDFVLGREAFPGDLACCAELDSAALGSVFGFAGDGLSTITTASRFNSVISNSAGRVKVVDYLGCCGTDCQPGYLGCGQTPGNSIIVVRMTEPLDEGELWLHEYGHNLGLSHNPDSRYVMYAYNSEGVLSEGISSGECSRFHAPPGQAGAAYSVVASCTDADFDDVQDRIDNCPTTPNNAQSDLDGDEIGDFCDNCPYDANPFQEDADLDNVGNLCESLACLRDPTNDIDGDGLCAPGENCPWVANGQEDTDQDGAGDACDNCLSTPNPGQSDRNHDGLGDMCDPVACGDPYEPDFGITNVRSSIQGGEEQVRNFCGAPDYVRFHTCPGRTYVVSTAAPAGSNPASWPDTLIDVYDPDLSYLGSDDNGGGGLFSSFTFTATRDGSYKIGAHPRNVPAVAPANYVLRLEGDTSPCEVWSRTYADGIEARSATQLGDGGFVAAGGNAAGQAVAVRTDTRGQTLWSKTYRGSGAVARPSQILGSAPSGNGTMLVAGNLDRGVSGSDLWVARLDSDGNVLWNRTLSTTHWETARAVSHDPAAFTWVVGSTQTAASNLEGLVAKFNEGQLLWQRRFYVAGLLTEALAVLPTSDGGAYVAGKSESGPGAPRAWLAKLASNGDVLWQRRYDRSFEFNSLAWSATGDLLVGGLRPDHEPNGESDILLARLDREGDVRWAAGFHRFWEEGGYGVAAASDDGAVVFGYSTADYGSSTKRDMVAIKVDRNGVFEWSCGYGGSMKDEGWAVAQTDEGGFLFGGSRNVAVSSQKMNVFKTGSTGRICSIDLEAPYSVLYDGLPVVTAVPQTALSTLTLTQPTLTIQPNFLGVGFDCSATEPPGEVATEGSPADYFVFLDDWTATWGSTDTWYDVYRGDLNGLPAGDYGACFASDLANNVVADFEAPVPGGSFTYLVAARNAIGAGPLGTTSSGTPRNPSSSCP